MGTSSIGQTLGALRTGREEADRLLDDAAAAAARIEHEGAVRAAQDAAARLSEIGELRAAIAEQAERLERETTRMTEAMTAASGRLLELSAAADFSPPEWPARPTAEERGA